jgi:MFS transporter, NNP family, nitrate/nitrite transporter
LSSEERIIEPVKDNTHTFKGQKSTLLACFLHFDLSFMLWVLLGALGIYIAEGMKLTPSQKGLVVAIPILSGSLLRIPLGLLSDRLGGKRVGTAMLCFLFLPLFCGWLAGNSLSALIGVGLMLGTAGASFAVALPLASRWYPPEKQGLVMGIAAAGNSGTVITNLIAPRLANIMGWHNVLAVAMLPLLIVLIAFIILAKESPNNTKGQPLKNYLAALKVKDLWWFCLLYSITFGGYVGLSSFLPIFFRDQYTVSPINAGYLTAMAAFAGSCIRPLGGYLADKFGGVKILSMVLLGISGVYMLGSRLPGIEMMVVLLFLGMLFLGTGNGAVFQLVPQRFRLQIGVATGTVGAIGGLGGFLLPMLLGNIKQASGSFSFGFLILGFVALGAAILLRLLITFEQGWRFSWRISPQTEAFEDA